MSDMPSTHHLLEADLRAIQGFAGLASHDPEREREAAMALYDDVCWRTALVPMASGTAEAAADLEEAAGRHLAAYLRGELDDEAFWQAFAEVAGGLDALLTRAVEVAARHGSALQRVEALRRRVAEAGLPPTARFPVDVALGLLQAETHALLDGKLVPEDFDRVFAQGLAVVEDALAAPLREDDLRLQQLAARAFADDPPPFLERGIARRLLQASERLRGGHGSDPAELSALERLIERAAAFRAEHDTAAARLRTLVEHPGWPLLAGEARAAAEQLLSALRALGRELDEGDLQPMDFHPRFTDLADRLALALAADGTPQRVAEARERVAAAHLPPFVARTAAEVLDELGRLARGGDVAAFAERERQLEACLALGAEVAEEESACLRRYQTLAARAAASEAPPLLRGPVEDALETLRGMLHRLHAGLYPPASFHHDFEREAGRLSLLLLWQDVLAAPEVPHAG